ncbi:MAG: glucosamine-6-phosphate deaminase [Acutalibacteraceae bacterium]|nr:glucosamine-6-phosphate deaminase [Acutalibacteraceae bacterium]
MKILNFEKYEQLCDEAASIIAQQVKQKPDCVLGLATGSSPVGIYQKLIEKNKNGEIDFSKVKSVNLDEYVGLSENDNQSYRYFMNTNLFNHINIDKNNTNVPSGVASDMQQECIRYDKVVENYGGIDLQLLGIGLDGHIGFNEPDDHFPTNTHVVKLDESTIDANARFFNSIDEVPKSAITIGIKAIMQAKKVLLVAGGNKIEILKQALEGPVTPNVPASILQFHPDVTVIVCED